MILRILEEAEAEFADAIARYQSIELGLGFRLKEEVKFTLAWIADHPESPRIRSLGYRRINLKVFPYYVAYTIHADTVWVLAIAHSARRPEYWIRRSVPRQVPPAAPPFPDLQTFRPSDLCPLTVPPVSAGTPQKASPSPVSPAS